VDCVGNASGGRSDRWTVSESPEQDHLSSDRSRLDLQYADWRLARAGLELARHDVWLGAAVRIASDRWNGSGDVKLLAGIAAFVHIEHTWYIFVLTTVIGAIMATIQIALSGQWLKHYLQAQEILREIVTVRDADKLYEISQERKPRMRLLPYGIPMTIAAIGYFAFAGMLF
jgi:Flp pilus assembly protein protease CpaA